MPRVAAIGQCAADTLCIVPHLPHHDSKLEVRAFVRCAGGPAATAAATVQRLGGHATFIGHTGDDAAGAFVRASLDALGVDTTHLRVRRGASSHEAFVMVDAATGARTIVWTRGGAGLGRASELPRDVLRSIDGLLLDSLHVEAGAEAARLTTARVFLDGGTARDGVERVLRRTDVCFATRAFLRDVTGVRDVRDALRALARRGPRITGVTLGHDGAIAYDAERASYSASAGFDVRVVDTTGAGDVFHGAIAYALLHRMRLDRALSFANAAAALACTALGAQGALPALSAIRDLLDARGTPPETPPTTHARAHPADSAPDATARRARTARAASPTPRPRARRRSPTR